MKLCISTLGCHDRSLKEIISLLKKYSMDAVEIRGIDGELDNLKITDFQTKQIENTKKLLKEEQIQPLILGTSCKYHDPVKRSVMIERTIEEIRKAHELGFKAIRVFGNLIIDDESQCIEAVGSALDEVCAYAELYHVQILLEVHGDFNTVERLQSVISHISHQDSFGLIWDVQHTHPVVKENWLQFYKALKHYIVHVHLKDVLNGKPCLPGQGEIQLKEIVNTLLKEQYTGYFSLEWERKWFPELDEIESALNCLLEVLK